MQLTRERSTMEKYSTDPLVATGRYCSLFSLIFFLISAAAMSFSFTSVLLALVSASTRMSSSSSNKFPLFSDNLSRSIWSRRRRALVLPVTSSNTFFNDSSSERCSFWITRPSNWSSNPFCVTVKSTMK